MSSKLVGETLLPSPEGGAKPQEQFGAVKRKRGRAAACCDLRGRLVVGFDVVWLTLLPPFLVLFSCLRFCSTVFYAVFVVLGGLGCFGRRCGFHQALQSVRECCGRDPLQRQQPGS
ncbi:hypothetical protein KCP75_07955 [Salmonella enterica subsp. enterica]|nr:hypothetical protein KCP75_07955 [Salmonella enterica subsp. enterica]